MKNTHQIIVIGAGIAGLVAAYELQKAGIQVIILESSQKSGGRMVTETYNNRFIRYRQLSLDFVFPGLFKVSFCLLLSWLFARSLRADFKLFYLCLVPLFAGLFDYLENICIVLMLTSFPNIPEMLVASASALTIVKSTFTTACFVFLVTGCIFLIKTQKININQIRK